MRIMHIQLLFKSIIKPPVYAILRKQAVFALIYNSKKIDFIENAEIGSVQKHVTKTKYYGNQIYNGTVFSYTLIITLKMRSENDIPKQYRVKLNEFQLEMAYQALSTYNVPATASIIEKTETGGI